MAVQIIDEIGDPKTFQCEVKLTIALNSREWRGFMSTSQLPGNIQRTKVDFPLVKGVETS